jgi:hypothetical protein
MEQELEVVFGELARKDPATQARPRARGQSPVGARRCCACSASCAGVLRGQGAASAAGGSHVKVYRGVLDWLSDHRRDATLRREPRAPRRAPREAGSQLRAALTTAHLRLGFEGATTRDAVAVRHPRPRDAERAARQHCPVDASRSRPCSTPSAGGSPDDASGDRMTLETDPTLVPAVASGGARSPAACHSFRAEGHLDPRRRALGGRAPARAHA